MSSFDPIPPMRRRIALLVTLGGLICVSGWCLLRNRPEERIEKVYDHELAEGLRVWDPKSGIDNVRIGSCRVEKRRSGPIAFGGLNVLCVDGLVLNLPFRNDEVTADGSSRGKGEDSVAGLPLGIIRRTVTVPFGKVSGLRVNGLSVNRVAGKTVSPVFAARGMQNRGRSFQLSDCVVYDEHKTNFVGNATLTLKPEPILAWKGGCRELKDLFNM